MGESDCAGRVVRNGRGVVCVRVFLFPRSPHFFLKVHHAVTLGPPRDTHADHHGIKHDTHAITTRFTPYNYIHTRDPIFFFEMLHFFLVVFILMCNGPYSETINLTDDDNANSTYHRIYHMHNPSDHPIRSSSDGGVDGCITNHTWTRLCIIHGCDGVHMVL